MQERTRKTVRRIEEVAVGLFAAKGVAETTIKDIARGSGLSEGALYRHFASKDDLVWRTFQHHYVALAARLGSAAGRETATREKLGAMIREICQAHDDDATLFTFLVFVQHGQLSRLDAGTPTPVTVFRDVIASGIAHGDLPAQDADLATAFVLGLVLQPMTFAAYGRLGDRQTAYADRMVGAAWAALTSPASTSPTKELRS
jgi:AcrR family transcriptional regulator